jgi:formylglycine-generating enzyme
MAWIEGGAFRMGSDRFYREEMPVRSVSVDGFWIDRHPVTVREFARFVRETGYVTCAERPLDPAGYPGIDPSLLVPGSLVFRKATKPIPLHDYGAWWRYAPGASWAHPEGPESTVKGRERHPVTHVANEDAAAYANWAGKELPSEAEWEYAARGGVDGAIFTWGDEERPGGRLMANSWQGEFPWRNLTANGYDGTSRVGTFPPNGFGLYDMAGNVWEWTSDFFAIADGEASESPCCPRANPRMTSPDRSYDLGNPGAHIPRKVIKGGSHLCSPAYCLRYRPAARQPEALDTSTSHIGFRCLVRPD